MKAKSWKFWSAVSLGAVLLITVGAMAAYVLYYKDRALPNTTVSGITVAGMTPGQVTQAVQTRASETTVDIDLNGVAHEATLEQLGYTLSGPETVDRVFAANKTIGGQFAALFQRTELEPAFSVDDSKLAAYTDTLAAEVGAPAVNAAVKLGDGGQFNVEPGQPGVALDTEQVSVMAGEAAQSLQTREVALQSVEVQPSITTEAAQTVADQANKLSQNPVELTTTLNVYEASAEKKASWVEIPEEYSGKAAAVKDSLQVEDQEELDSASEPAPIGVNKEKVALWVKSTTEASNDDPQPGLRNINSRGDVVSVVSEGASGWKTNNEPALTKGLLAALQGGEPFSEQITYDEIENTVWEEQLIADGAENLAYQAAEGEKWIDINLSNYTTTAYEGATVVRGPVAMVPGAPGTETVTGKYKVWAKVPIQTMRGDNLDGTRYETPDVPWILYFHGGYALHGAYWRSSFGYGGPSGSHGCVNMPIPEAKWFYDWASEGTTVVSHF